MKRFFISIAVMLGAIAPAAAVASAQSEACWPATEGTVAGVYCSETFTPNASTTTTTTAPATTTSTSTTSTSTSTSTTSTSSTTTTTLPPAVPTAPMANVSSGLTTTQINALLNSRPIAESTASEPSGNFRTACVPSHISNDDPIVYPGQNNMAHNHTFWGNTGVNENSTYASLRTTGNSSCEGGVLNRSGYWMPSVFDSQGRVIVPSIIIVYYKTTASGGTLAQQQAAIANVQPLPNGLRMIAGSPNGHFFWQCVDGSNYGTTIPNSCPDTGDNDGVIAGVDFPDCWDGVHLDSVDHRSHMAYRSYVNGIYTCPSTHPVQIPSISQKVFFGYRDGVSVSDISSWRLSSDMGSAADGSSLHFDWFGAWEYSIQDRWFNKCDGGADPIGGPYNNMRSSNNGDLCDGQGLIGAQWSGVLTGPGRVSGFTPMQMP